MRRYRNSLKMLYGCINIKRRLGREIKISLIWGRADKLHIKINHVWIFGCFFVMYLRKVFQKVTKQNLEEKTSVFLYHHRRMGKRLFLMCYLSVFFLATRCQFALQSLRAHFTFLGNQQLWVTFIFLTVSFRPITDTKHSAFRDGVNVCTFSACGNMRVCDIVGSFQSLMMIGQ